MYPMDARGYGSDGHDLLRSSSELLRQAPGLFLRNDGASQLELRMYNPKSSTESLAPTSTTSCITQEAGSLSAPRYIHSTRDLLEDLKVGIPKIICSLLES